VHLTAGQAHESQALETLLEGAQIAGEESAEILRPVKLVGDKGFRADWIDEYLLAEGIQPVIPSKATEDRAARGVKFDRKAYRQRNIIERLIGWLKESRRIFSRFEKTAINYLAMLKIACIHRYLRLICN
jgi:transposase